LYVEADLAERPVIGMETPPIQRHQFLETISRRGINGVAFRDVRKFDSGAGHYREL